MDKFKTIDYENFEEGDITNNYKENSQPLIPNKNANMDHENYMKENLFIEN